jgi:hypothetical protein
LRRERFSPCAREAADGFGPGYGRLRIGVRVRAGEELATVIRSGNGDPARNHASTNWLAVTIRDAGANGRDEREASATGAVAGLDPREAVGVSGNRGRTFTVPAGRHLGLALIPAYVQEYADGRRAGQPYYWADGVRDPSVRYRPVRRASTITQLAARVRSGRGTLELWIDGRRRRTVALRPGLVREDITPAAVRRGARVALRAVGVVVDRPHADRAGARLAGLDTPGAPWRLDGTAGTAIAAVYALPWAG